MSYSDDDSLLDEWETIHCDAFVSDKTTIRDIPYDVIQFHLYMYLANVDIGNLRKTCRYMSQCRMINEEHKKKIEQYRKQIRKTLRCRRIDTTKDTQCKCDVCILRYLNTSRSGPTLEDYYKECTDMIPDFPSYSLPNYMASFPAFHKKKNLLYWINYRGNGISYAKISVETFRNAIPELRHFAPLLQYRISNQDDYHFIWIDYDSTPNKYGEPHICSCIAQSDTNRSDNINIQRHTFLEYIEWVLTSMRESRPEIYLST